jgi:hypothetical protein
MKAQYALSAARFETDPNVLWRYHDEDATIETEDGFTVKVQIRHDDDGRWEEDYGKFHSKGGDFPEVLKNKGHSIREHSHFTPAYHIRERMEIYNSRYWGMSKAVAYATAVEDAQEAMRTARETFYVGYIVEVTNSDGESLGEDSCWGFDVTDEHTYFEREVNDAIEGLLTKARTATSQHVLAMEE